MGIQPIAENFSSEEIQSYVVTMLGGTSLQVKLNDEDFKEIISMAFSKYSRSCPRVQRTTLSVSQAIKSYPVPAGVDWQRVIEIQPQTRNVLLSPQAGFTLNLGEGVITTVTPAFRLHGGIDALYEIMIYGEMLSRTTNGEFGWDVEDGKLWLTNIPPDTASVAVLHTTNHDFNSVPVNDRDWIKEYSLALGKIILGRKLNRFNMPGPAGQPFLKDAELIAAEGKEEKAELEQRLKDRALPLPPTWGA